MHCVPLERAFDCGLRSTQRIVECPNCERRVRAGRPGARRSGLRCIDIEARPVNVFGTAETRQSKALCGLGQIFNPAPMQLSAALTDFS
jgi:hypothetical protein